MMKYIFALSVVVLIPNWCFAVITFETLQNGSAASDNFPLDRTLPFIQDGVGVTFGFDLDSNGSVETNAVLEMAGGADPTSGFGASSGEDTADPGFESQLGDFFLRQPTTGQNFGTFVINYDPMGNTITAASGEIWDIDGAGASNSEQFRIQAFDATSALLATIDSPEQTAEEPLDGRPFVFNFSGLSAGIERIEITFTGTKIGSGAGFIGLAFNNFFPTTTVPEPSASVLATLGLASFACYGWRRRKAKTRTETL